MIALWLGIATFASLTGHYENRPCSAGTMPRVPAPQDRTASQAMIDVVKDVAASAVEGLRQQPLLLALVVLQVVLLAAVAWTSTQNRAADKDRFALVMSLCGPKAE